MKIYLLMTDIYSINPAVIEYSWWLNKKPYRKFPHKTFGSIHTRAVKVED